MPRSKAYDPDVVLENAMKLFWAEGYETTSIPRLEQHLGLNRFSIYDSFQSKRNMFLKALDLYTTMLLDTLVRPLERGTGGLRDLDSFLLRFQQLFVDQKAPRGCLLCNTATELGHRDKEIAERVKAYFERAEMAVLQCLLRAQKLGELEGDRSALKGRARIIRTCMQGVLIDLRLERSGQEIRRTLKALGSVL